MRINFLRIYPDFMKKFRYFNTYYRLLILIIGTSVLFFLLYIALYIYTTKQENSLHETSQQHYYKEVSSILHLHSKSYIAAIVDVTFWSEFQLFTKTRDKRWYDLYIAEEFDTYDVDYLAVYDVNDQFIAKTSNDKIKTINFIPKAVMTGLFHSKLTHFFLKIPEGVVEVFGATIHPSDDPKKNKSKPSGFFFMVRLLDKNYFQTLSNFSGSEVRLYNLSIPLIIDRDILEANIKLTDYKNSEVAILSFKRPFNLHFKNTKEILFILILASLINLIFYLYFSRKWIYKPLKTITDILETGNEKSIAILQNLPGEFHYIGNLFQENGSQRKLLELSKEKAEESDKLKSSFLANLSHEIRTPMNAIVGFSDLLNEPNLNESLKEEYLKIIKNCGINLVSIIEDLLAMSKIDSKQIIPNYKGIDLDACLKELYNTIKVTIPNGKELELSFIENKESIKKNILTDEIKLKQIIVNLISNAIKYTEKGQVTFGYHINEDDKTIVFKVKDTGLGIDEENLKVIFDRFRRIEDEFSIKLSGLGLGLAISKAYVEMLGGTISVHSQIKVGSEFTFTIPLVYDNAAQVLPLIDALNLTIESNFETILVAEDDNINFLLFKRILELKQYKVLRAVNGQEAVDMCRENRAISLVFMDIKMPVLNGFEAFKLINSFNPKLPVIAQTAYTSVEDFEKIMQLGFTAYVSKPLDKEKIYELIQLIFQKR